MLRTLVASGLLIVTQNNAKIDNIDEIVDNSIIM